MPGKTKAPREQHARRLHSLRSTLIHTVLVALLVVSIVVLVLFRANMIQVLMDAETMHVSEMLETMEGSLRYVMLSLESSTEDWATWDETYYYLAGANPNFPADNIQDHISMKTYRCNFIFICDAQGNLKFKDGYDYNYDIALTVPAGMEKALPKVNMQLPSKDSGHTGIFLFEGRAYLVSTMPVTTSSANAAPIGTFTRVSFFDESYFQNLTKLHNSTFTLEECGANESTQAHFEILNNNTIAYYTYTKDVNGIPVRLTMTHPRSIYTAGVRVVSSTSLFLLLALCVILALLFLFIDRNIIRKIRHMSRAVETVDARTQLGEADYGQYLELSALGTSINGMVLRLEENRKESEQTEMFRTVLPNILNSMDAYLYVTDPATDEILFMNDKMREHFDLPEDIVGQICWKVLQSGFDCRCAFCPNYKLEKDPGSYVVWEEHNTVTGNHYRNTDCYIEWTQGKLVHLQHSVDITDIKLAESALKKRLEQQELMASLSQSFIDNQDGMDGAVERALRLTGEFMDISRLLLGVKRDGHVCYEYEWCNPAQNSVSKKGSTMQLGGIGSSVAKAFAERTLTYYNLEDAAPGDLPEQHFSDIGAALFFPVYINEQLWGVLELNQCNVRHQWTPSDINLGELISGLFSGVVSRKHMETQLKRLSSIVESAPQFISLISEEGEYEYCNPAVMQITGYSKQELFAVGRSLIFSAEGYKHQQTEILPKIMETGSQSFEMPLICRNGEQCIMQFSGFMLEGGGIGAIGRDITQQRQLEQDLIRAKELAEQGSMAKGEFLSRMSHEMRTPMNAIIGMTNIARNSKDAQRKEYCLEKINNASTHLLGVINDILDMSKIEANKFELSCIDFNFERMLMNVVNVINFRVDEKHQELLLYLDPQLPLTMHGDEQRFTQVLSNLLTNAAKFTPEHGNIALSVRLKESSKTEITLLVDVKDSGIGISQEQQSRLFRSFEQADGGIARRFGGTGLGLAISKRIVELMNGEIWVESELNAGSTFSFTAKLEKCAQPARINTNAKLTCLPKILVVDDSQDALDYFQHIMQQLEMPCDTALSGAAALDLMQTADPPYDMLFIDWRMPEMNGVELAQKIKENHEMPPVIIMVSVAEWSEIEQEATQAGINSFLSKPLFSSNVLDCIHDHFHVAEAQNKGGAESFRGKHILLAEDVEINREIVLALLEDTGVEIDIAENGQITVDLFAENPDKYQLILMDVQMPEVDGLEATRRIRAMECTQAANIPIVAMTANVFREDVEKCLAAGMDDHLSKPLELDKLFAVLETYLNR